METSLVTIRFDPETLRRSSRGAITGLLSLAFDAILFPAARWSDFVVVVIGWWIDALRSNDRTVRLRFMDGPYYLRVSREAEGYALVECIESRRQDIVTGSFRIPFRDLRQHVEEVGRRVLSACAERRWESDDLRTLAQVLDDSTTSHA